MAIFNSYVKLPEGSHLECDSSKNFRRMPLPSMLWWEKQHLITATQCLHLNPLLGCQVNQGTKQEWHCAFARLLNVNLISRAPKKHHKYDPVQHHTASIMDTSDTSDISPGCFFCSEMTHETWPRCHYQTTGGPGAAGEIFSVGIFRLSEFVMICTCTYCVSICWNEL